MTEKPHASKSKHGAPGKPSSQDSFAVYKILVMVVVVPIIIAVAAVFVPMMIVVNVAAVAVPIARKKLLPVVMRSHPSSAFVWRLRPVTLVPLIFSSFRIPIALDPHIGRARASRDNSHYAWARRRSNSNSERNLRVRCGCASHQQCDEQQCCPNEIPGDVQFQPRAPNYFVQISPPTE
jgi:hypothetical protein